MVDAGCQPCAERQAALTSWVAGHGPLLLILLAAIAAFALWPALTRHATTGEST